MDEELQFVGGCSYDSFRGPNYNGFIRQRALESSVLLWQEAHPKQ